MLRQLRDQESGMVLVMVLMVVIIMMVYSIGVVTRGTSQRKSVEEQIDSIKAEQLTLGAYAKTYTDLSSGNALPSGFSSTLDNKTYVANVVNSGPTGPNNTNTIVVTSPYTF